MDDDGPTRMGDVIPNVLAGIEARMKRTVIQAHLLSVGVLLAASVKIAAEAGDQKFASRLLVAADAVLAARRELEQ